VRPYGDFFPGEVVLTGKEGVPSLPPCLLCVEVSDLPCRHTHDVAAYVTVAVTVTVIATVTVTLWWLRRVREQVIPATQTAVIDAHCLLNRRPGSTTAELGAPVSPSRDAKALSSASSASMGAGSGAGAGGGASADVARGASHFSQEKPFVASILGARYLTAGGAKSDRRVIHVELDISDSGIAYIPGARLFALLLLSL
jgi:hypothetical protein